MATPAQYEDENALEAVHEKDTPLVTCHTTRPGKAVFTERKNADAWIATDLTVDLDR